MRCLFTSQWGIGVLGFGMGILEQQMLAPMVQDLETGCLIASRIG